MDPGPRFAGLSFAVTNERRAVDKNDPYVVLLRRELIRAQARMRRAERERDRAVAALEELRQAKQRPQPKRAAKARRR